MSNLKQAVDQIKNFTGRVRGLLEAADILDGISNIEVLEKELASRCDVLKNTINELSGEIKATKSQLEQFKSEANLASQKAEKINKKAILEYNRMIDEAKIKAKHLISDAEFKSKSVDEQTELKKEKLKNIVNDMQVKNNELAQIKAKISETKKKISDFIGS